MKLQTEEEKAAREAKREANKAEREAKREAKRAEFQKVADEKNAKYFAIFQMLLSKGYPASVEATRHAFGVIAARLYLHLTLGEITPEYLTTMGEIAETNGMKFRLAKRYSGKTGGQMVGRFFVSEDDDGFDGFDEFEDDEL